MTLPWDQAATAALEQAMVQVPVPGILKGRLRRQLEQAAQEQAAAAGRASVTPEDLMAALLAKMPPAIRAKVEEAMKQGPEGLARLQKEFRAL